MARRVTLWLLVSFAFGQCARASGPVEQHFIQTGGIQRRYLLHLPPRWTKQRSAPAILMLHGGGSTPERSSTLDLDRYGDMKGFMVAYPAGINGSWNDGRQIPGRIYDDVGFISALMDELVHNYNADPKRIYVTGMSNGGFMAFTLACRIPLKIAAIAPVAGSMGAETLENCHPQRSVSVMMINGTADPLVKFEGGKVLGREGSGAEAIAKVAQFWRTQACGAGKPVIKTERLPDVDPNDDSDVEVTRVHCSGGEVVNYTVRGGGHTWPGGKQYAPSIMVGPVNQDFSASKAIVDFFSAH